MNLKTIPEIIKAASATPLGILALLILVVAAFGYYFFRREKAVGYRFAVWVLTLAGTVALAWAVLGAQRADTERFYAAQRADAERVYAAQRADAERAYAQLVPKLKLNLQFLGVEIPNPYNVRVLVYVQPSTQSTADYALPQYLRSDVPTVPGPGGLFLEFPKLAVGDRVYVEVEEHGRKWRSYPMTMLEANLNLQPSEP